MQAEVSSHVCRAIRTAHLGQKHTFEQVALCLNAIWDGAADELDRWLQVDPRGMTEAAAQHLAALPGFSSSESAQRLVSLFAPPPVAH